MTEPPGTSPAGPVVTPIRVLIGLCLLVPVVAPLWVSSYAKVDPTFIGIPFFYWYQLLWVPLSALLTSIAYVLVGRDKRRRAAGQAPKGGASA